jgi:hypothetical protein
MNVQTVSQREDGWLELLLRPDRYFLSRGALSGRALAAVMLLIGVAGAIDRLSSSNDGPFLHSWGFYWLTVGGGALITGPLRYFIGGAFYRLRLRWSGAQGLDAAEARGLYARSELLWSVPGIAAAVGNTLAFRTPAEANADPGISAVMVLFFVFWSTYAQYRAALAHYPMMRPARRCSG